MSIELGKFNQLEVVKEVDFGVYLGGEEEGEILLPTRYVPEDCKIGDFLNVFLYLDMDERLIATTLTPLVQLGYREEPVTPERISYYLIFILHLNHFVFSYSHCLLRRSDRRNAGKCQQHQNLFHIPNS